MIYRIGADVYWVVCCFQGFTQASQPPKMPPTLAKSLNDLITDMNSKELFTDSEIAKATNCSARDIEV